jgi:carbonic anhydrase
MKYLPELFAANARWAEEMTTADPSFFTGLAAIQTPPICGSVARTAVCPPTRSPA